MAFVPVIVSAVLALALDQASKRLVLRTAHRHAPLRDASGARPRLRVCMNRAAGVALLPPRYALSLWGICLLGTMVLIGCAPPQGSAVGPGLGVALGGAASNLFDILRRGAVVDFIDLRIWPVFNIADACIVLGLGGALWSVL